MAVLWQWGEGEERWRITSEVRKHKDALAKVLQLERLNGQKWVVESRCPSTSDSLLAEVVRVVQRTRDREEEIRILREELANLRAVKQDEEEDELKEINAGLLGLLADGGYRDEDDDW